MDNKNNRQFFWEVKQFFNKPQLNESTTPKPDLLNTVKNILSADKGLDGGNAFRVREGIVNSGYDLKQKTSNLLNNFSDKKINQSPISISHGSNITSNIFNINEQELAIKKPKISTEKLLGLAAQKQDNEAMNYSFNATAPGMQKINFPQSQKYAVPGTNRKGIKSDVYSMAKERLALQKMYSKIATPQQIKTTGNQGNAGVSVNSKLSSQTPVNKTDPSQLNAQELL